LLIHQFIYDLADRVINVARGFERAYFDIQSYRIISLWNLHEADKSSKIPNH